MSDQPGLQPTHNASPPATHLIFRWRCVILPITVLVISTGVTVYFLRLLPASVGWHFSDSGADIFAGREAVAFLFLVLQFLFAGVACGIAGGAVMLGRRFRGGDTRMIGGVLLIMGNMVALPQLVLLLAMLDILLFNIYNVHVPFLAVALTLMGLGLIALVIVFTITIRRGLARNRAAGIISKERVNV